MKKPHFFLLLFFFLAFIKVHAQNYEPFVIGQTSYFSGQYSQLHAIRIDSIVDFGEEKHLFNHPHFVETQDMMCTKDDFGSWIARNITIKSNEDVIFNTYDEDSILIKPVAVLNNSWVAGYVLDSIKIMAKITKCDTLTFFGITDSVKTIQFSAIDKNGVQLNNIAGILQLSKNNGIIKTFSFLDISVQISRINAKFTLIGIEGKAGVQNLTWKKVFDLQVGDEIHVIEGYFDQGKIIRINSFEETEHYYIINGTEKHVKKNDVFNTISGFNFYDSENHGRTMIQEFNSTYQLSTKSNGRGYARDSNNCWLWGILSDFPCDFNKISYYIEGLGGPYYYCFTLMVYEYHKKVPVYYKKGNKEWGTPLSINKNKIEAKIDIFPNPATSSININIGNEANFPLKIELINTSGQTVYNENLFFSGIHNINRNNFNAGIYFLRITDTNGKNLSNKIVFQ